MAENRYQALPVGGYEREGTEDDKLAGAKTETQSELDMEFMQQQTASSPDCLDSRATNASYRMGSR